MTLLLQVMATGSSWTLTVQLWHVLAAAATVVAVIGTLMARTDDSDGIGQLLDWIGLLALVLVLLAIWRVW